MKKMIIKIMSNGCPSCIVTAIPHLLRIKGIRGVRIIGTSIAVLIEDWLDPETVIKDSVLNKYYKILSWSIEKTEETHVNYTLKPVH